MFYCVWYVDVEKRNGLKNKKGKAKIEVLYNNVQFIGISA